MDLIKKNGSKYEEYERLLLEKDQLIKESENIWISYLRIFGQIMTENYEEKIECIKCKKTIAFYQSATNRGGKLDAKALQKYLDREMADYYVNLRRMTKENEDAQNAKYSSPYEVKRSKEIYRRLAKLIHPDLNPATDDSEELRELWSRITIAYACNNVKELAELEVLVRKVLNELGLGIDKADIPDLEDKIEEIKDEISEIISTEPYSLKNLVEDEEVAQKKRDEILKETEEYKKYHKELSDIILKMISDGGVFINVE